MKRKLTILIAVFLVIATVLPTLASCDAFGSGEDAEWYYRKQGDSKIYLYLDKKAETMTVLVEDEEGLVSDVFDVNIKDDEIKIKDGAKNKETYSFKEKSDSYIVINDIKFKLSDEPEDYGLSEDSELTVYDIFGHPDSECPVTTDPADETTRGQDATTKERDETTKHPYEDTTDRAEQTTQGWDDTGHTERPATTPREEYLDSIPTVDWNGYEFKLYYATADNAQTDFECNNPNGIILNDRVYSRNYVVEKRLNITIVTVPHTTSYKTVLQNMYAAGYTEGDYDMVTGATRDAVQMGALGYVADIAQYEDINIFRPYWDQSYVDSFMIGDSLYSILGDYSVQGNIAASSICFNKDHIESLGLKNPYDLVYMHEWTVDKMLEYMDGFIQDVNSNAEFDWDIDRFGISGWGSESGYSIFYGSGFRFCLNNGNDMFIEYNRDLLYDIIDTNIDLWTRNGAYYNDSSQTAQHHIPFEIFSSGRGLFCDIQLKKISMFLTEMEDDYGILPVPKYNAEQDSYYSFVPFSVPILLIPRNDPNPTRTGHIIETICAASHDIINIILFEIVTHIYSARCEEDENMIGIIVENKIFDPAYWLNLSGYSAFSRAMIKEQQNMSQSYISIYHDKASVELAALMSKFKDAKNK